ncbi:cation:proton antiporter [Salibacterium qingdaonense]|uniref:Monovalent cation:H+ antiporter-2, CPA2 family n=1 Tax=Salibacterium qingdaonense TaxID=266892 RepID=A0A1I4MVD2_9BACI|nr:cation:proton antiporter [Salibacterium qingdaonense]SFM07047.1 monovalent cation:H+ antiporter-2, CPA2 family [Salibacterium qingdaonense]
MELEIPELLAAGLILFAMFVIGFLGLRTRIPDVILFILAGIVFSGLLSDSDILYFAGEIGIVLLFFMLGMEFPIGKLGAIAKRVTPAGLLDLFLNFVLSTGICLLFGLDVLTAFLIGGILYATSSSITLKMLQNTKRTANPESEFLLGVLIFEDMAAPVMVAVFAGIMAGGEVTGMDFLFLAVKVTALTLAAIFLGRFVFSKLKTFIDRNAGSDIFHLFLIGLALIVSGTAVFLELSEVLGAFLAGIMLAETGRSETFEPLIQPVRELTLPLFFLWFGTQINLDGGVMYPALLTALIGWSLLGKWLTGMAGGRMYGLSPRSAFRAGLSFTPRGEFSIIIASAATAEVMAFGSLFIVISSAAGIALFLYAPALTKKVYGSKQKKIKPNAQR